MFPILYYEYNYSTVYNKNFIMIHSLVNGLGYHEAIVLLHKATIKKSHCCFYVITACIIRHVNQHKFLFHITFPFWCLVLVIYITPAVFWIRKYLCSYWQIVHLVNLQHKLTISINTIQYYTCIFSYDFNNIFFSLSYFIVRIQYTVHVTYKIHVIELCMLSVRLSVNSKLLIVQVEFICRFFCTVWGGFNAPN